MKKLFAILAILGIMSVGLPSILLAQDATAPADSAAQTTQVAPAPADDTADAVAVAESTGGFHQAIKTKFIEGGAMFMSLVAIVFILGLAFALERIIYLSLADVDSKGLLNNIGDALDRGDVEGAKDIARNARGPVASIIYQGLLRLDQGPDVVERSVVSYGGVQSGLLERNLSWITLFIAIAPSLGFLGTVIGMVKAFDDIQRAGDISPTIVAAGMKVALITTVFGLIVAIILQIFYNYILSKLEGILNKMEDASITFLDHVIKYNVKYKKI
ncbi:MAG: MotA/TolQ/ExbB proton channel family protein [Petrimonas sp.]|nr:MotA/TolQ/ExbB proton channel family protein [Petrimonas sp.]